MSLAQPYEYKPPDTQQAERPHRLGGDRALSLGGIASRRVGAHRAMAQRTPADAELVAALDKAMASLALRDAADVDVESALLSVQRAVTRRTSRATQIRAETGQKAVARRTTSPWRMVTLLAAAAVIVLAARAVLETKGSVAIVAEAC